MKKILDGKCTRCNKELSFPDYVLINVESYNNTVLHISNCCGKAYKIGPINKVQVYEDEYKDRDEDDWGNPINYQIGEKYTTKSISDKLKNLETKK